VEEDVLVGLVFLDLGEEGVEMGAVLGGDGPA